MSEDVGDQLGQIAHEVEQLRDLMQRRLLEDKNTKQLVQAVNASLERRDEIDSHKALTPMVKELLLAIDRLTSNEPTEELNQSVADELLTVLARYGVEQIDTDGKADPTIHNIVGFEPLSDGSEHDDIIKVTRTGFTLAGSVLRPAQVRDVAPSRNVKGGMRWECWMLCEEGTPPTCWIVYTLRLMVTPPDTNTQNSL